MILYLHRLWNVIKIVNLDSIVLYLNRMLYLIVKVYILDY